MPAVSPTSAFCEAGGLASYSADIGALAGQCATFVDKILKGAKPAEIPVELPTKFELVINMRAGHALGLTFPTSLLMLADDVIE